MATLDEISSDFYSYLYSKQKKELENSDKPEEKKFTEKSVFQENFQIKVNAIYNRLNKKYSPEQANYIYNTLVLNLEKQSKNPGQSKIIDSTKGEINVQNLESYSKKVEDTVKAKHPEKFEVKGSSLDIKDVEGNNLENKGALDVLNKIIDFNNPEQKKAYFDNLYNKIFEAETLEEKVKIFSENFYDISDKKKEEQEKIIDALEIAKEYDDKLQKNISDGMDEKQAAKEAAKEIATSREIDENIVNASKEYENIIQEIHQGNFKLTELIKIKDTKGIKEIKKDIQELKGKAKKLESIICEQNIEKDVQEVEKLEKIEEKADLEIDNNAGNEYSDSIDMNDLYGEIEEDVIDVQEEHNNKSILNKEKADLELDNNAGNEYSDSIDMNDLYGGIKENADLEINQNEGNEYSDSIDKNDLYGKIEEEIYENDKRDVNFENKKENLKEIFNKNSLVVVNQNKFINFFKEKIINPIKNFIFKKNNKEKNVDENNNINNVINSIIAGNVENDSIDIDELYGNVENSNENNNDIKTKKVETNENNIFGVENYGGDVNEINAKIANVINNIGKESKESLSMDLGEK